MTGTTSKAAAARKRARRREREDRDYLAWVHTMPCAISGKLPVVAHHEPPRAMGGGGDWHDRSTVPLTEAMHLERHRLGREAFEAKHGVCMASVIRELNTIYGRSER